MVAVVAVVGDLLRRVADEYHPAQNLFFESLFYEALIMAELLIALPSFLYLLRSEPYQVAESMAIDGSYLYKSGKT